MITSRTNPASNVFLLLSRFLLFLLAVGFIAIPWSERYLALDVFPKSPDVESNLLALLAVFGLLLIVAHLCRRELALVCWICDLLRVPDCSSSLSHLIGLAGFAISPSHQARPPHPPSGGFNFPLQI